MKSEKPVPVTGVWLRSRGDSEVEVLVEIDGQFRLLGRERIGEGTVSHIWEPLGILQAPVDKL